MGAFPHATRAWLSALLVAGLVGAGPTAAAAAPAAPTSPPARTPAATAPPIPTDYGPPCTIDADKLYPVVCVPDGSGEDTAASLPPGDDVEFDAQVVNNGPDVADATVVITLPAGLVLESDETEPVYRIDGWYDNGGDDGEYTDLTCVGGPSTITCGVGALPTHANILVALDLQVSERAAPDTTLTLGVALQPAGTDSYPSTSITARIDVLEPSTLAVSLTPATLHTVVGHRATMTGIVHNEGPGAAPEAVAVARAVDEVQLDETHFTITNGTAISTAKDGSTVVVLAEHAATPLRARLQRQALRRHAASVRRNAVPSSRFWPLGTIAPGSTTRVPIRLEALSVGTDTLTFGALSVASNPDCGDDGDSGSGSASSGPSATGLERAPTPASTTTAPRDCAFAVQARITAIRPPAAAAPLADTGSRHLGAQLAIALWALVLGSLLAWAGRRRVAGGRH